MHSGRPARSRSKGELTRKGEQTRQRIVAAAADLMLDQGVARTTMDDVRAQAGVSSSQIYHYFADKQALVRAVIEHQADAILSHHEPVLTSIDGVEGLRAWRDGIVEHQRELGCRGGCPIGSLGSELADTNQVARADIAAGFGRWEAAIRTGLREMHVRGQLAADANPDDLAIATLAALQGGLLLAQIQKDTKPLEKALDAMIALIVSQSGPGAAAG
jgi:TetR/AcrR family transcriptional regulator, transcriptional repressor for nem operon